MVKKNSRQAAKARIAASTKKQISKKKGGDQAFNKTDIGENTEGDTLFDRLSDANRET